MIKNYTKLKFKGSGGWGSEFWDTSKETLIYFWTSLKYWFYTVLCRSTILICLGTGSTLCCVEAQIWSLKSAENQICTKSNMYKKWNNSYIKIILKRNIHKSAKWSLHLILHKIKSAVFTSASWYLWSFLSAQTLKIEFCIMLLKSEHLLLNFWILLLKF